MPHDLLNLGLSRLCRPKLKIILINACWNCENLQGLFSLKTHIEMSANHQEIRLNSHSNQMERSAFYSRHLYTNMNPWSIITWAYYRLVAIRPWPSVLMRSIWNLYFSTNLPSTPFSRLVSLQLAVVAPPRLYLAPRNTRKKGSEPNRGVVPGGTVDVHDTQTRWCRTVFRVVWVVLDVGWRVPVWRTLVKRTCIGRTEKYGEVYSPSTFPNVIK